MTRPVVAAIIPGPDGPDAAALGQFMAELLDAPLILAGVVGGPEIAANAGISEWGSPTTIPVWDPEPFRRDLEALAASLSAATPPATEIAVAPTVATGVADVAEAHDAQLIVLTQHQHGLFGRVVDGDPAAGLARHAPCAILAATPDAPVLEKPKVIAVAWDRSPEATAALETAAELAQRAGALLRIVHVLVPEGPLFMPPANPILGHELTTLRRKEATSDAARAIAAIADAPPFEQLVLEGSPSQQLEAATDDVDLMIVGSRRHGPLRRVAIGSVSTHLLHKAHCPVLVVPRGTTAAAATR